MLFYYTECLAYEYTCVPFYSDSFQSYVQNILFNTHCKFRNPCTIKKHHTRRQTFFLTSDSNSNDLSKRDSPLFVKMSSSTLKYTLIY